MIKKSNRRIARERVLQILYAYELNGEGLSTLIEGIIADLPSETDKEFCRSFAHKIIGNVRDIDAKISEKVDNWELNRIVLIDKALLRMGIAEFMFFPDIPSKVTINEIIEIAKEYSAPNSGKFINGILDSVLGTLKKAGEFKKSGRGLLEESNAKKGPNNK